MQETTIPDELLPIATAIYELGKKARREGKPFDNNPFGGALNHRSWNMGWKKENETMQN